MDWYAKSTRRMRDPDYLRLPADLRGHHDALLALLADRERGPVLHGARTWNRRDWDRTIGATNGVIDRLVAAGLASWRSDDLHVEGYDLEGEERVTRARANGRAGAKSRWSGHGDPNGGGSGDPNGGGPRVANGDPNRVSDARDETRRDETRRQSDQSLSLVPDEPTWRPDFEVLYRGYPLKKGKDKGLALCRRQIRTPADFDELRRAIANYAVEVRGKDPQYTKHFSTFMACWRDYVAAEPPAPPPSDPLLDGMAAGTIR